MSRDTNTTTGIRCCPLCSGDATWIGALGARNHFSCRNCGMQFSQSCAGKPWNAQGAQFGVAVVLSMAATRAGYGCELIEVEPTRVRLSSAEASNTYEVDAFGGLTPVGLDGCDPAFTRFVAETLIKLSQARRREEVARG